MSAKENTTQFNTDNTNTSTNFNERTTNIDYNNTLNQQKTIKLMKQIELNSTQTTPRLVPILMKEQQIETTITP